jgi:outer membrane protein assembly factor BamD
MIRSLRIFVLVLLAAAVALSAGCHDKKARVASEEAREGRDRELFAEGIKEMQGGHLVRSRLLFNTLVNTYADSTFLSVTKLAIADSYYREGSFSSMNQAEVEYRDWLQFFPKHELADDVVMKLAEIHMRQVQAPDRDTTHAKLAEKQLLRLLQDYPNSDLKERAESQLWEVREILGMHELKVARFYFKQRQAYKAAASRSQEILDKYPGFSRSDEALYLLGVSMFEQEDTEEAAKYFQRLVKFYPDSEYYEDAVAYLKRLDAEVPEAVPESERPKPPPDQPGMITRVFEAIGHPHLDNISKDGVLFKKDDTTEQALEKAVKFTAGQQ